MKNGKRGRKCSGFRGCTAAGKIRFKADRKTRARMNKGELKIERSVKIGEARESRRVKVEPGDSGNCRLLESFGPSCEAAPSNIRPLQTNKLYHLLIECPIWRN